MGGYRKALALALILAPWYWYTGNPNRFDHKSKPPKVEISRLEDKIDEPGWPMVIETKGGPLSVSEINFNEHFKIETNRYILVKDDDWLISRVIGWFGSIPGKILFWDYDYGRGLDYKRTWRVLEYLENNKSITDVTIRLSHNKALYDCLRMFTEKDLRKRNNIVARVLLGLPVTIKDEIWAEFFIGDYYNPLTRTAVVYSNIESIGLHEIGHHRDFQRFTSDWEYMLARILPPVMLYQEAKASLYAKDGLKPEEGYQFYRYLMPAFMTYVLATYAIVRRIFRGKNETK